MRLFKFVVAGAIAAWGLAPSAYAFHTGGVAECEGCHTMHNSLEGAAMRASLPQFQSGPYLLQGNDQSSACLNCHQDPAAGSYHISTPGVAPSSPGLAPTGLPVQMTPGGDFAWLKTTRTGSIRNAATTWDGEKQGHNIIAVDYGFTKDTKTVAPGGSYPTANLACSSCHDPHGRYRRDASGNVGTPDGKGPTGSAAGASVSQPIFNSGSYTTSLAPTASSAVGVYRILGGKGYQPKSLSGSFAFASDPPDAVAPSNYNAVNTTIAGVADRVAYGRGVSEWCSNCHASMHNDTYTSGTTHLVHPAGNGAKLTATIAANYVAYVSSGVVGTPPNNGYSALAPFEVGVLDSTPATYTALKAFQAAPAAASTSNNVACVSCHRAHATAFESMTRYYTGNEFMTVADSTAAAIYDSTTTENKINTTYSVAQQTNAYNGRPATVFGPFARDYCNKCHAKD
jgi:hypothetical protein